MKISFFLSTIFISSIIFLSSCNSAKDMSEREENIFVQDYQSVAIPIDQLITLDDLITYLDSAYCIKQREVWPFAYLDLKKKKLVSSENRNTLKIGIDPSPCEDVAVEFNDKMILEIVKDGYNTEIEQYFSEIDSIPSFVKKQFLSFGEDPNYDIGGIGNGIWICTKKEDRLENLDIYVYKTVIGFISSVREYSKLAYNKSIDELSDEEYQEIRKEFVFHLSFKYTDKNPSIMLDI